MNEQYMLYICLGAVHRENTANQSKTRQLSVARVPTWNSSLYKSHSHLYKATFGQEFYSATTKETQVGRSLICEQPLPNFKLRSLSPEHCQMYFALFYKHQ